MPVPVIVYSPDLLLRQKLVSGIEASGHSATGAASPDRLRSKLADGARALIIEMDADGVDAVALIGALRRDDMTRDIPIAGFCAHTRDDLIQKARDAGANIVVSRGAIVRKLPTVIEELLGTPTSAD